jgi:subtilisin-like proprotein convertase family protein
MRLITLLTLCLFTVQLEAQSIFNPIGPNKTPSNISKTRKWHPSEYYLFQMDVQGIAAALSTAPMEFTAAAHQAPLTLAIPQHDGSLEGYHIYRVMACEQGIYDRHPGWYTFAGRAVKNPARTVRGSLTARGFRVMLTDETLSTAWLEPYSDFQGDQYIVYQQSAVPDVQLSQPVTTGWDPNRPTVTLPRDERSTATQVVERGAPELMQLKIYRFAVGCTGTFAQDNGGTQETALAAVIEYSNWTSSIMERDIALRLQVTAESENLIFINPDTDPFQQTDILGILTEAGPVINGFVGGVNKYDVGHIYTRYQGGSALGVAGGLTCVNASKANGVSGGFPSIDYGGPFVGVIGQEVGHQMSGGHTWNRCGDDSGRAGGSAFEPGSGTTIMSYAGSCGADNIQSDMDLYYHAGSIEEIQFFYNFLLGNECGTLTETTNHRPEVTHNYQNGFFIPKETPFFLDGSATDIDGDSLSYVWEQMDLGPSCPLTAPVGNAPLFRTIPPTNNTKRFFPKISTVVNNSTDLTEQLPKINRDMTFRLSARDNKPAEGGTGWKDVEFRATNEAGPFLVTYPNTTTVEWLQGEFVSVTWDVANTDGALVNCKKVNIYLSTNNGSSWPLLLAEGVVNDGAHTIQVPNNIVTTNARIVVAAADNIFYDMSNAKFKISAPTMPSLTAGLSENSAVLCLPAVFSAQVMTAAVQGYNNAATVTLQNLNIPNGAVVTLGSNTLSAGGNTTLLADFSDVTIAGNYSFEVKVTAPNMPDYVLPVQLVTTTNDFSTMALQAPVDGSTSLLQNQILRWNTANDAVSYDVQLATAPTFAAGTLIATKSNVVVDSFKVPILLEKNQAYYWRIRPNNSCSPHPWTEPFFFSTLVENCQSATAFDVPLVIPAGSVDTIESVINISGAQQITDINVKRLKGFHGSFSDMQVWLRNPQGTQIVLFKDRCANFNGSFNFGIDDDAPTGFTCPPSNTGNTFVRPSINNPLSTFNGQNANGNWQLIIRDGVVGEGGTLEAFELDYCASALVQAPFIVNNNPLSLNTGTNRVISTDLLKADDADNTPQQLTFTLLTLPHNGYLTLDNIGTLTVGSTFTQSDIDNGMLRYFDYGTSGGGQDFFRFTVSDGVGGYYGTPVFLIQPLVSTSTLTDVPEIKVFPNPATDQVWISSDRYLLTDMTIVLSDAAGRVLLQSQWPKGSTQIQFNTQILPQGVYFVQLRHDEGIITRPLILNK